MLEINLLPPELKIKRKKPTVDPASFLRFIPYVFIGLICIHLGLALFGILRYSQLRLMENKWRKLEPQRKTLEGLRQEYALLSQDEQLIQGLLKQRINWAQKLNRLSMDLPSGIWFDELSLSKNAFTIFGSVVSLQKEEMGLINKFLDNLKNDALFFDDFNNLELGTVETKSIGGYDVAGFVLSGSLKQE